MAKITVQQAFDRAIRHHQAGQLEEAEALYRQILTQQPDHADALHFLGVIAHQSGQHDVAADLIGRAIALKPAVPEAWNNLGNALQERGSIDDAIAAFRRAIALRPDYPEALTNLGNVLKANGQLDEAITAHRRAIALRPDYPKAHGNLGNALMQTGQLDEALAAYRRFIDLRPDSAEAHNNLGIVLMHRGRPDEAIAAFRQALDLRPNYPEAYLNIGTTLSTKGDLDEAITAYRQAMALKPGHAEAHSSLIYAMHLHPGYGAQSIAGEHRRWEHQHAGPLTRLIRPHLNDVDPDRTLRIGYVSPNLRDNPVGRFLLPLLAHHDHQRFEVTAYSDVPLADFMTQRLRSHTNRWRSIVGLSDQQAADLIQKDQIDILIDLTMHAANSRLLVFARKPAPVQVSYLAYCSSTGLETMDYRLSDPWLDPGDTGVPPVIPSEDHRRDACATEIYTERTIRLPETYWCYQPHITTPEVNLLPALERGSITFGCLNDFAKVSEPTLATWARLLRAVPQSRLLLHTHRGSHRQRVTERLEREGIDPKRGRFVGRIPTPEYFETYQSIDIALDTFPWAGGTTTCDALWMGVPVVSLAGQTAVGRGGLSILSNVGLPELVGRSDDDYVRIATDLSRDLPRLSDLRSTLRQRMERSPLMDAPRFARNVEAAYRQMWRTWCEAKCEVQI